MSREWAPGDPPTEPDTDLWGLVPGDYGDLDEVETDAKD